MAEKTSDSEVGNVPVYDGVEERKKDMLDEGGVILGDVGMVEKYGYVQRG